MNKVPIQDMAVSSYNLQLNMAELTLSHLYQGYYDAQIDRGSSPLHTVLSCVCEWYNSLPPLPLAVCYYSAFFPHTSTPRILCSGLGRFPAAAMKWRRCLWYVSCQSETRTSCGARDCKTCGSCIGLDCFVPPVSRSLIEVCDRCSTVLSCVRELVWYIC